MEKTLQERIEDLKDRKRETLNKIKGNNVAKSNAEMRIGTLNRELKEINQTIKFYESQIGDIG